MPSLVVPPVPLLPAIAGCDWLVPFADGLLTILVRSSPAALYAGWDRLDRVGRCWLWPGREGRGVEIATLPDSGTFRALLARFGVAYLGGQLYGGQGELVLLQDGRAFRAWLCLGNSHTEGFWLQATAEALLPK